MGSIAAPGPLTVLRAEGPGAVVSEFVGSALRPVFRRLVQRDLGRTVKMSPPTDRLARLTQLVVDLASSAATYGAALGAFGGVAIDLMVGGGVRERKDVDVMVSGGPPDILNRLRMTLEARGFGVLYRRSGEQVVLCRGDLIVDLYRLIRGPRGDLSLTTRLAFYHFTPADFFQNRTFGHQTVPIVNPIYVAAMKLGKTTVLNGPLVRSAWEGTAGDRTDLAALSKVFDLSLVGRASRSGAWSSTQFAPFSLRGLPRLLLSRLTLRPTGAGRARAMPAD